MSQPEITVVICCYNGAHKLPACLDALGRQTLGKRAELIVVDDGSKDATAEVAGRYEVQLIRHPQNRGLSAARNTGIEAASAPVIAFTDDDCVPTADWLERLIGPYDSPGVVAVGGPIEPLHTENLLHRYYQANNPLAPLESELSRGYSVPYRAWLYAKRNAGLGRRTGLRSVYSIVGANLSVRRDALQKVGCFDPARSFARAGDDEDLCTRLRASFPEGKLLFVPEAVVRHDYDKAVRDTLNRALAYGKANAENFMKHEHLSPTVFPTPILVAALVAAGLRKPVALGLAAALPVLMAPRWGLLAVRRPSLEPLLYAYLQLLQESAHDVGFATTWLALRKARVRSANGQKNLVEFGASKAQL